MEKRRKKRKKGQLAPVACMIGSLILSAALSFANKGQSPISGEGRILREGYGGEDKEYPILIDGLEAEKVPIMVTVGAQAYTEKEADAAFTQAMELMEERIRAQNPSLMEVRSDLTLPGYWGEGIRLRWHSSDMEIMDSSGKLNKEVESEQMVTLMLELSAGLYRQNYEIPVRVLPPVRTPSEEQIAGFLKELKKQEQEQQTQTYFSLPGTYKGKALKYEAEKSSDYGAIIIIGVLMAILLAAKGQNEAKQKNQKRERELLLDYSDLLSKIMVLTGAGLTVRNAWGQMVKDYETGLELGKQKQRPAYEEMRKTYYQMQSGMAEGEAYRQFGRRCRLQPYLKLSGLLEQNRKAGTKNIRAIFQAEMADALEQRKNLARRLGEEAGTKLLLPLFLMLGIIMTMVMVPAMMTMG